MINGFRHQKENINLVFLVLITDFMNLVKLEEADVQMQLSEPFTPEDAFMFGSRPVAEPERNQSISKESLSFDEVNYSLKTPPDCVFLWIFNITRIVYACFFYYRTYLQVHWLMTK